MLKPIIFYDIPSTTKIKAWSPNTWKTRYALNYKKLPYKTLWVEYPDIEKLSKEIGIEPTGNRKDGSPYYSLPAIQDLNTNTVVSDSYRIAEYLEKTYPDSPKLFPEGSEGLQAAFHDMFNKTIFSSFPLVLMKLAHNILLPRSQEYFQRTREETFGKKLAEFSDESEVQWEGYKVAYSKLAAYYDKNGGGYLIQGNELTYLDFNVAAFFAWCKYMTGEESDEWKNMLTWDNGKWAELMEALKPYEGVDE